MITTFYYRRFIVFAHDLLAAGLAWLIAFWLRFNLDIPDDYREVLLSRLPWVLAVHAVVFWALGLYRGLWRYASLPDLRRILIAVAVGAVAVPAVLALLRIAEAVPRSAFLMAPLLLVVAMGGSRFAYRAWREGRLASLVAKPQASPVLVLGGGMAAAALVKELAANPQWRVVGLLDDDPAKRGAELGRQIARFTPARLVLFEVSEFALYSIAQEFEDRHPALAASAVIGDAKNEARVAELFARYRPEVVFHAAAYKHVPLMEQENAFEAVRNNVLSTVVVARAAQAHGTRKLVLVSTDKAVNPVNVMGASKRLAELACQALQAAGSRELVIVRFGNVLGSAGSVVPRFREQIASGGPVTVTHPQILRYFMSIPEAAQLVLQAGEMGKGGEIYVLDMGEPVLIVDLAKQMIRLSGFADADIRIEYTGLRAGKKRYEELLADSAESLPQSHPKLPIAQAR